MIDYRMKFIQEVESALLSSIDQESIPVVSNAIIRALNDYEITKRCTEIAILDDTNEKLLKRYCACLMVDGKSIKTIEAYRRTCMHLSDFSGKPFTDIGVYDIRFYLACEKERGLSNRSIENTRANLSAFFQWLTVEELIPKNPCMNIKPIKYKNEIRLPFSDTEIDAMRSYCAALKPKYGLKKRALIELLASSGIRVSELANMKVSDIDFDNMTVRVRNGKGGKERITYMSDIAKVYLQKYLEARPENGDALFYNKNHEVLSAGGIRSVLKGIEENCGVSNIHPHRFRRTFATGLANRGMNVQEIQKLLGHSTIDTTMEYVCVDDAKTKISYQQYIA